jgi:hypothetical protein
VQLGIDFKVRPDYQRHQPELTTTSREVLRPFDVFDMEEPLIPGLPPLVTDALEVSHLLGVLLPPMSTRPCFMPNPPIGFGVVRPFPTCSDLPKDAPPRARSLGCYPSGPYRWLPRVVGTMYDQLTKKHWCDGWLTLTVLSHMP